MRKGKQFQANDLILQLEATKMERKAKLKQPNKENNNRAEIN